LWRCSGCGGTSSPEVADAGRTPWPRTAWSRKSWPAERHARLVWVSRSPVSTRMGG
jgi:hypothetical protein